MGPHNHRLPIDARLAAGLYAVRKQRLKPKFGILRRHLHLCVCTRLASIS